MIKQFTVTCMYFLVMSPSLFIMLIAKKNHTVFYCIWIYCHIIIKFSSLQADSNDCLGSKILSILSLILFVHAYMYTFLDHT